LSTELLSGSSSTFFLSSRRLSQSHLKNMKKMISIIHVLDALW
jgi:hypothetical protein